MTADKKISYEMQGKARNYLGKQKMVKAPLHWQSGPNHPPTQLAYITKPELDLILKKDLHGSLKKGPNIGPSGIMSLNDPGTGRSGTEMSSAETTGSFGPGLASTPESRGIRAGSQAAAAASGKGTVSTGGKNLLLLGSALTGNIKGVVANIASRFMPKPKTEKEKSEKFTKKGFDVLNPNEMRAAKYKPTISSNGNGEGGRQITFDTQALASTAIPETKKSTGWGFKAYQPGSTAKTRLYGKKGKMIKANQGEFSQGKRFGPPPKKGPDPQGIDVPLNSIDYFKDLL